MNEREQLAERAHPLAVAADLDAELRELQSFVLVETGHAPTVNAVSALRTRVAKALGHTDWWCVAHCRPGAKHADCGCRCGQHRRVFPSGAKGGGFDARPGHRTGPAATSEGDDGMSEYRFVEAFPATIGYGPALAVVLRETGQTLGWVRRVEGTGHRLWVVYGIGGQEVGESNARSAAADFLKARANS